MGKGILVLLCLLVCQSHATLKYCAPKMGARSSRTFKHACEKVYDKGGEVQCAIAEDRFSCLMLVISGHADFTVAEPEDLRLLLNYNEPKVEVTHQLMKFAERSPQLDIEMIAIVRSNFNGSWTTKGKKLCYLGLETGSTPQYSFYYTPSKKVPTRNPVEEGSNSKSDWKRYHLSGRLEKVPTRNTKRPLRWYIFQPDYELVPSPTGLRYFESWLFPATCDAKRTTLENRIASLSNHFDSACVAGSWSLDETIDAELKAKYSNLCALCADPESCDENDRYYGLSGALSCLRQGNGDVAWVSKSDAAMYFVHLSSMSYSALCPDGTFASLTGENICTWIKDPQPVIIANKQVAELVLEKVIDKGEDMAFFYQVYHSPYKFSYLKKLKKPIGVMGYLESCYLSSSVKLQKCRSSQIIRWCISTDLEEKKCRYLKMASEALGLKPAFSCVRMHDRGAIYRNMDSGKCEVFTIKSSDAHEAQGIGLKSVIDIVLNKRDDLNMIGAVVRRNASFKSYEDLKGASACFTGYRNTAWNAFYSTLKSDCSVSEPSDINAISSYFKQSCVLDIDRSNKTFPGNLYSLCKDEDAHLDLEEKTFKCLEDGADVAFVNVSAAKQYSKRHTVFSTAYKVLCSKSQDNSCFLTKVILGSILVHENITKVREDEIYLLFLALDRYFGRAHDRESPIFSMYEPFEGHSSVLFPAATMALRRSVAGLKYGIIADKTDAAAEACEVIYGSPRGSGARADFFWRSLVSALSLAYLYA